jgi:hypothetical protein
MLLVADDGTLIDFSTVLATFIASLSVFMKLSSGTELDMLDIIGKGDALEDTQDADLAEAAESSASGTSTPQSGIINASGPQHPGAPKKLVVGVGRKSKVAESWEATAEDEAHAEDVQRLEEEAEEDEDWDGNGKSKGGEKGLLKVLKAFQKLKADFDTKFHKMWA